VHGITTEQARAEGMPLADAVEVVADALVRAGARGVPLVGMKLDFDLTMLDTQCRRIDGTGLAERGWRGPVLDGLVIDRRYDRNRVGRRTLGDLCAHYAVRIDRPHDAACDAEAAVNVVLAMCARYPELGETAPMELFGQQVHWHRTWVEALDGRRRAQQLEPLDPSEFRWPIANSG
jgi:DNA polymerase-3 subunit epsilon